MSIILRHTGLAVPHGDLEVTELDAVSDLSAYTAVLSYKGRPAGSIEDTGRGGGAIFTPLTRAHLDTVRAFVAAARRSGQPVGDEEVYDDLIREYDMELQTQKANRLQHTLVRGFSPTGSVIAFITLHQPPERFTPSVAHQLARDTPQAALWEVWTGSRWAPGFPPLGVTT
ncbi:hypothetical protein [Streptomyces sp. NBC_01244]|uniref:hypothetical protein n=1 Tax=Streptomyces sp. NBC_01244 TaxID=2903797 RepID=UPI002E0E65DD|nr:hypothetical protein OG247_43975 [Streptomyces sp. NBC_01244]